MPKLKVTKKKKAPLSAQQKADLRISRQHIKFARDLFKNIGFARISYLSDKEFEYKGFKSDFDDVFVSENILVVVEYTTSSETSISDHLKKKNYIYDSINKDPEEFVEFLKNSYPSIYSFFAQKYANHHFQVRVVYAARYPIKQQTKKQVPDICYLDYNVLRYFQSVSNTIKNSAKYEFLGFLSVQPKDFSGAAISTTAGTGAYYPGSILPETHSHFPKGFKVVSFYVDAAALLSRSYVLRRDGWRHESDIYQRMILKSKVEKIRKHLLDGNNVFVNNIIVTLPSNSQLVHENNTTVDISAIKKTTPGKVNLPIEYNSIGIVDGQHRVYSYHEGGTQEERMAVLRDQQNLLVTGIMFPPGMTEAERIRFEAKLFLEINSNQTNPKSELKQEIGLILKPYSADSIAKKVMNRINDEDGPLSGIFGKYFYDKFKLKTTTVVSYGLRPLVKLQGDDSIYSIWVDSRKADVLSEKDDIALNDYINYCSKNINLFFSAVKNNIGKDKWSTSAKEGGILNTTFVNGVISLFRRVVRSKQTADFNNYNDALASLKQFDFKIYKSSQYNQMGEAMYKITFLANQS